MRAVAEEIAADPAYRDEEPLGPDDEARERFRRFARETLGYDPSRLTGRGRVPRAGRREPPAGSGLRAAAASAVVTGTAAISPIEPTRVATISLATASLLSASVKGVPPMREDQQHGQRRADVREHERVHRGRDVVAPDGEGAGEELPERLRRIRALERHHGR